VPLPDILTEPLSIVSKIKPDGLSVISLYELIGEAEDGGGIVRRIASAVFKSLVEVICMTFTRSPAAYSDLP
jgi:hypothetical protein